MGELTPGEIQCNVCGGIFELKLLSERTSKILSLFIYLCASSLIKVSLF